MSSALGAMARAFAVVGVLSLFGIAQAAVTRYSFTGTITGFSDSALNDPLWEAVFPVGGGVSGYFELDDSKPDSNSMFPNSGYYEGALVSSTTTFGTRVVAATGGALGVGNNAGSDIVSLVAGPGFSAGEIGVDTAIPGWDFASWNWSLMDSSGEALSSDAVPPATTLADLSLFDIDQMVLVFRNQSSGIAVFVWADLDTVNRDTAQVVPEPSTYSLASLSLIGAAAAVWCRRRARARAP